MDDAQMNLIITRHVPAAFGADKYCPPTEAWAAHAVGDLSAQRATELDAHAQHCRRCAAERRLAHGLLVDEQTGADADVDWIVERIEPPSSNVVAFDARRRRLWQAALTLAAAAMLIVAIVPGVDWLTPGSAPPIPDSSVVRGSGIRIVGPRGDIAMAPEQLQWQPVAGASSYRVSVSGVDGEVYWQGVARAETVTLPSALRERLHPAVVYNWQVEAFDRDDRLLARSQRNTFRVSP